MRSLIVRGFHVLATRLTAAVVVVGFLTTGCGSAPTHSTERSESEPPVGAVSTSPPVPPPGQAPATALPESPGTDAHGHQSGKLPPVAQAPGIAARFAALWARPGISAERWRREISPLCEPGFAARLSRTDPAAIPASRITGPPVVVPNSQLTLRSYTVATDSGVLRVTVAALDGKWRVTTNDFQRAP